MTIIEQSICDAIDIIVDKAISEAGYDRTVQATVVSCVDPSIGKYKVKYQDSTFYAYSEDIDISYSAGSSVYVLIPSNDMAEDKTILGTTKKLGSNYITTTEGDAAYEIIGTNILTSSGSFDMSSYKEGTYVKVLYSKDYPDEDNLIDVDPVAANEYFGNSNYIICGGTVRTALPTEQQYRGNYGIIFALDFLDNTENAVVTRYYVIDVDNMTGNPYKLIYDTRQYGIFEIDSANFIEVNSISIFCYDFPNSLPDDQCIDDIFISNLELSGANRLSDDDISNYSLTFITSKGTYFTTSSLDSDTLTIEAQVRVKGKVVDNNSQNLSFYWGTEHAGINTKNLNYCKYLGQGWKCLNEYNVIEKVEDSDEIVIEWIPASYIWTVKKTDIIAKEVQYKCAVVYDGVVITHTIVIKNLGSEYEISIESDSGTQFYYDQGYPTLTCLVNGESHSEYTYSWASENNTGTFESIAETPDLYASYEDTLAQIEQLETEIANETKLKAANEDKLEELYAILKELNVTTIVYANIIYHLNVNTITSFSTYKCTVYSDDVYIGTASIVLLNTLSSEGSYSLVIHDGTYAYKYDESGLSPACGAVDSPIEIKALTFTIYDNLGQAIDDEVARHCDISWTVPTINTLIEIPSSYTPTSIDSENGTATYSNLMSFTYTIADRYDVTKTNNDMYLNVIYKGMILSAQTNLTFIKEGEPGTNGTEYICKIVTNPRTGTNPKYWIITENSTGSYTHNFTPASTGCYLKVQFYHNENLILDSVTSATAEGKTATITWSILQNKYTSSISDYTSLSVDSSTGIFSYSGYNNNHPAHIVKATIVYDGVTYYTTFPVITVKLSNNNYQAELKEGTGFSYATYTSDGLSPKYDNTNPFEVTVMQYINEYWEDVSTLTNSDYVLSYDWEYLGRIYENSWINDSHLENRTIFTTLESNQLAVKPSDSYDGQCVTNALQCIIKHSGTEVARIHIPVHLMLNRYGLSYINSWDGNSVEISAEGGFILAPQVGAGMKNTDNSFTGVIIGAVKESGSTVTETGLFGYSEGVRTIFLDASSGKAVFGASGKGQIIIDPSSNEAIIKSGNYDEKAGTGLEINLTEPYIHFGSGNFMVESDGSITATAGKIAGFYIDENSLWTGSSSKTNTSTFRISSSDFSRTINQQSPTDLRLASNNTFAVGADGTLYATTAYLGSGSQIITLGKDTDGSHSAIYYRKGSFSSTSTGFYIGTDGIALGSYSNGHSTFQVSSSGELYATSGYIGNGSSGWTIKSNYLVYGDKTAYNDTSNSGVFIGTTGIGLGSSFYVSSSGVLYARSGTIGGWTINDSALYNGSSNFGSSSGMYIGTSGISLGSTFQVTSGGVLTATSGTIGGWTINSSALYNGSSSFTGSSGMYIGTSGIRLGSTFSVTSGGVLTATSGTIGGWTIDGSTLHAGNIYLSSDGQMWGGSTYEWHIYANGTATFTGLSLSGISLSGNTITSPTINGGNISGTTISGGTISGGTISGGTISGATLDINNGTHYLTFDYNSTSAVSCPSVCGLRINEHGIRINTSEETDLTFSSSGITYHFGSIQLVDSNGSRDSTYQPLGTYSNKQTVSISTTTGTYRLTFCYGLLVGVSITA